jgi:hypothetical protein
MERNMSNLVHNEQMRLVANLFNNLAVVSVATGFIAPLFSIHPRGTLIGFSAIGRKLSRLHRNYTGTEFVIMLLKAWHAINSFSFNILDGAQGRN